MRKQAGASRKRVVLGSLAVLGIVVGFVAIWAGPTVSDLLSAGFTPFQKSKKQTWTPETETNLKALYTSLKLHHDSEGQFPVADQWMDAALTRVATAKLPKKEAKKKFIDPAAGGGAGVFGFALNDAAAAKYIDDIQDRATTPLIFQATVTGWNAHGDPKAIGRKGGMAISVDGTVMSLQN